MGGVITSLQLLFDSVKFPTVWGILGMPYAAVFRKKIMAIIEVIYLGAECQVLQSDNFRGI